MKPTRTGGMTASEKRALLHSLTQNRLRFEKRRAGISAQMRRWANELEKIDRRLRDIDQSVAWLEEG